MHLFIGDLTSTGHDTQMFGVLNVYHDKPVLFTYGNHDTY